MSTDPIQLDNVDVVLKSQHSDNVVKPHPEHVRWVLSKSFPGNYYFEVPTKNTRVLRGLPGLINLTRGEKDHLELEIKLVTRVLVTSKSVYKAVCRLKNHHHFAEIQDFPPEWKEDDPRRFSNAMPGQIQSGDEHAEQQQTMLLGLAWLRVACRYEIDNYMTEEFVQLPLSQIRKILPHFRPINTMELMERVRAVSAENEEYVRGLNTIVLD